jgi:pimeloyl-ACP methyl ester carboxylesterase
LAEIRMPALGIYGQKDRIVDPDQGEVLARGVPNAELCRFERSGHFPMLDEPQRFYRVLGRFLNHRQVCDVD